jgi:hypothetical protein
MGPDKVEELDRLEIATQEILLIRYKAVLYLSIPMSEIVQDVHSDWMLFAAVQNVAPGRYC